MFRSGAHRTVYHVHIRKTGGTSLNHALIEQIFGVDSESTIQRLREEADHRLIINDKVLVGWSRRSINQGNFDFGYSHVPFEDLSLPQNSYLFTCLRDPIERLHSHYKMLRGYLENGIIIPCVPIEGPWARGSFTEFVERMPRQHRENQLYTFSKKFDVSEALQHLGRCQRILLFRRLSADCAMLAEDLQIDLTLPTMNVSLSKHMLDPVERDDVLDIISDEYQFFNEALKFVKE